MGWRKIKYIIDSNRDLQFEKKNGKSIFALSTKKLNHVYAINKDLNK